MPFLALIIMSAAAPFFIFALAEKQLSDPSQRIHKVLETARVLYGLIHARYILTAQGLSDMVRARHCSILIETPGCIL